MRRLLERDDCATLRRRTEALTIVPEDEVAAAANEDAARRLLEEWSWSSCAHGVKMICANGDLADASMVLSGCVRGNAVPYTLGAGAASKGSAMYQMKYMRKESVDISACASVLEAARQAAVHKPTSSADDVGEPSRNAKHFIQHCLNHAHMELEGTQAAGVVLGVPSANGSKVLDYHSAWDHIAMALSACDAWGKETVELSVHRDVQRAQRHAADAEDRVFWEMFEQDTDDEDDDDMLGVDADGVRVCTDRPAMDLLEFVRTRTLLARLCPPPRL